MMATLDSDDSPEGILASGDIAIICFADECLYEGGAPSVNESHLQASLNKTTGYGAFIWYPPDGQVWISDNPRPPALDPRVIADPGYPLFHDPASALPLSQFQKVLEEFCYSGTGTRPERADWVPGDMCGRRAGARLPPTRPARPPPGGRSTRCSPGRGRQHRLPAGHDPQARAGRHSSGHAPP